MWLKLKFIFLDFFSWSQETPLPGAYESGTFLEDLQRRQNTYRFKSDGRKIDPHPHGKGALLLPGAYEFQPFLDRWDNVDSIRYTCMVVQHKEVLYLS